MIYYAKFKCLHKEIGKLWKFEKIWEYGWKVSMLSGNDV